MSLSLYGVPDGQQKGQSAWPCPSVYSPTTALGSLSSVALSSAPASVTLAQSCRQDANYHHFCARIWSGFLVEATNTISSGFLREATGIPNCLIKKVLEIKETYGHWQQPSRMRADDATASGQWWPKRRAAQRSLKKEKSLILSELLELTNTVVLMLDECCASTVNELSQGKQLLVIDVRLHSRR